MMLSRFSPYRARALQLALAVLTSSVLILTLFFLLSPVQAWDEESLSFFEPWNDPGVVYSDSNVSSIHFDLVGALALAAGFSVTDAKTIQLYSQLTDSGVLTGSQVYSTSAQTTFPVAPTISEVLTSTFCPSPTTTAPTLTMGFTDTIECPGCFTSRWGIYNIFFHFPHDRPNELGAIRSWAFSNTVPLTGVATYGFSSTVRFDWTGIVNIYETTACFVTRTVPVDTGSVVPGSLEALGIYLHSLGDSWSHGDCIAAADAAGEPFAAHVAVGPNDPLAPCRWLMHEVEFGDPGVFPDSNRTFSGTLALYQALLDYVAQSDRPVYPPIPLAADGNHIYNALYDFVHTDNSQHPQPRREIANQLRDWSGDTRATSCELYGDTNCDCQVNSTDIQDFANRWQAVDGDPAFDPHFDLDNDWGIDVVDLMLAAASWGDACPETGL